MSTTYTEHYNFGKQENYADLFSMKVITDNWDTLDELLYAFDSAKQNTIDSEHPIDGTEVRLGTYSKATSKEDIAVNDTVKTALGKVEKRVEDNENNISSLRAYGGLKNYATINNGTYTANSGGGTHSITIPLLSPITGDIVISIGNITSNDVDSSTCAFVFKNDITSQDTVAVSRGDNINVPVSMGTFVATKVEIYPAATYQTSSGDTVSWTDLMICTKEDWDNSHDYQPYALSNADLSESVLKLQERFIDCQFIASRADYAEHTFTVKRSNTIGRYHYGIFMVGTPSTYGIYKIFYDDANTPASATVEKILGNSALTYTASVTWNGLVGTLTLTGSDRAYGGIRGIWFD